MPFSYYEFEFERIRVWKEFKLGMNSGTNLSDFNIECVGGDLSKLGHQIAVAYRLTC